MKKKLLCLGCLALLLTGCGEVPKLDNGQDAIVTFNEKSISINDLYENMKDTYALQSLINLVDKYVLEETFPDYLVTAKQYAESIVSMLKEQYPTEEEQLAYLQNYGINSIEAYQELLYIDNLTEHATNEYAKSLVEKDNTAIKNYYKNNIDGDIEVSHILITSKATSSMTDEEKKAAETEAENTAKDIIKKLKDSKKPAETFKELVKEYSEDATSKDKDGSLGKINKTSLSSSYDELVKAAYELKDGAYSKNVIKTSLGYHVILKTKSYEKPTLDDVKSTIIDKLTEEKVKDDTTISTKAMQNYRNSLGMDIQDSKLKTQYAYYIQNQLSQ